MENLIKEWLFKNGASHLYESIPTLLSTMEAEIRERIGNHEDNPDIENTLVTGINHDNSLVKHGTNSERSRILALIKNYFKIQV